MRSTLNMERAQVWTVTHFEERTHQFYGDKAVIDDGVWLVDFVGTKDGAHQFIDELEDSPFTYYLLQPIERWLPGPGPFDPAYADAKTVRDNAYEHGFDDEELGRG